VAHIRPAGSLTDQAARVDAAVVAATRAPAVPTPLQATATPARPRLAGRTVPTVPLHTSSALGGVAGEPSAVAPVAAAPSRVPPGTVPDALRGTNVRPVTATPDDGCRATGLC
jgi:hypothetical protein